MNMTQEQSDNKRLIKGNMLEAVRENPDMATFYARKSCKHCYGRGIVRKEVPVFMAAVGLRSFQPQQELCRCVVKNIDKESTQAVSETT